jgi:hypothetical protein
MDVGRCTWRCVEAEVCSEEGDYGGISSGFNFGTDDMLDDDSDMRGGKAVEKGGLQGSEGGMICR